MDEENKINAEKADETDVEVSDMPEMFSEILEGVPPEQRKHVSQMMVSAVQMGSIGNPSSVISKKLTEEHISEYLAGSREEMQKSYQEKRDRKIFSFLIALLGVAFILVLIVLLKDKPEILEKIVYTVGGIIAGAFGGYGYGKTREDD